MNKSLSKLLLRTILLGLCWVIFLTNNPVQAKKKRSSLYSKSVFQTIVVKQKPDYDHPWSVGNFSKSYGTAFLISGKRIITNSHVISNAITIYLKKEGDPKLYEAVTTTDGSDCDLALIQPKDNSFFRGTIPLKLGQDDPPDLDEEITALGFPLGVERLSITRAVISRLDFDEYTHSFVSKHLLLQVDAAINGGNSGGPVLWRKKVVGVAFEGISDAQSVGFAIPMTVVKHFLKDAADDHYEGFVKLNIEYQPINNTAAQDALSLPDKESGVLVSNVFPNTPESKVLQLGDVILKINNEAIYSDGTIRFMDRQVPLEQATENLFAGDTVFLSILRDGKILTITTKLQPFYPEKIIAPQYETRANYLILSGLIFQPLSDDTVTKESSIAIIYYWKYFIKDHLFETRKAPILLTGILPDIANQHIRQDSTGIVHRVNGFKISSMADLLTALQHPMGKFHSIQLTSSPMPILLPVDQGEATKRVLSNYQIPESNFLSNQSEP